MGLGENPVALPTPPLPSVPAAPVAQVQIPQSQLDRAQLQNLRATPSGVDSIQNPLLHGLAKAFDIAGHFALPGLTSRLPGTTDNHDYLVGRMDQRVKQDQEQELAANLTANTGAEARIHTAQANSLEHPEAAPPEYDYVDGPNGKVAILKGTTTAAPVTVDGQPLGVKAPTAANEFELWHQQNPQGTAADFQALQAKPISQQEADALNRVTDAIAAKHGLPTGNFKAGMPHADAVQLQSSLYGAIGHQQGDTRIVIQQQGLGDRERQQNANMSLDTSDPAMQASVNAVANGSMKLQDVFGRGATTAQKAQFAAAVKAVNPAYNSGDHDIENAVRRDFTSGHDSNTLNAVNTAYKHLDTFAAAARSLNNGDVKGINQLANALGVQFQSGASPQVISGLVKEALKGEVARALTGAGATVDEQRNIDSSFSNANSLDTMLQVANTAKTLLKGKSDALSEKYKQGLGATPNFTGSTTSAPAGKWNPKTGRYE